MGEDRWAKTSSRSVVGMMTEWVQGNERVLPKQPDEFVCRSCFLVKHPSQLAAAKKILCRDCV